MRYNIIEIKAVLLFCLIILVTLTIEDLFSGTKILAYHVLLSGIKLCVGLGILWLVLKTDKCKEIEKKCILYGILVSGCMIFYHETLAFVKLMTAIKFQSSSANTPKINKISHILQALLIQTWVFITPITLMITSVALLKKYYQKLYYRNHATSGSFGDAAFASECDYAKMGLYNKAHAVFGKDNTDTPLYYPICSRLIVSPSGGGKGVSVVIPALLTEDRSIFCFDPKGENFAVTVRHRTNGFNRARKVIALDPFQILKQVAYQHLNRFITQELSFNPLDCIREDEFERDRDINALVNALVVTEGNRVGGSKTHWDQYSEIIITGLIDYTIRTFSKGDASRNLLYIHDLLALDKESLYALFDRMSRMGGGAAAAANKVIMAGHDERGSLLSSAYQHLRWINDANMRRVLKSTNFDWKEFPHGEIDIFLILPEDQLSTHQRFVRLVFTSLMNHLQQLPVEQKPKREVLFLMDELGQLGYCKPVEDAITILRGRGGVIWSIFQSRDQIKIYPKSKVFESAELKQFFCTDEDESLKWIMTLAGKRTVCLQSSSKSQGSNQASRDLLSYSLSSNTSDSTQEAGVDLLPLNRIREMPYEQQIVFIRGQKVITCNKVNYLVDNVFEGLYDGNPLEKFVQYKV